MLLLYVMLVTASAGAPLPSKNCSSSRFAGSVQPPTACHWRHSAPPRACSAPPSSTSSSVRGAGMLQRRHLDRGPDHGPSSSRRRHRIFQMKSPELYTSLNCHSRACQRLAIFVLEVVPRQRRVGPFLTEVYS